MYTVFSVLITTTCFLLIFIILMQNPKGGGLSGSFGGSASPMIGVKKQTDILEKITWALIIILIILVIGSNLAI